MSYLVGIDVGTTGTRCIIVDQDGRVVREYTAGDCRGDSQVYGTGELRYSTLRKYAYQTAHEMLTERGCPDGKVSYDRDILPEDIARQEH